MDNDNKVIKAAKKIIKNITFKWNYRDLEILSDTEGNELIRERVESDSSLAVVRGGATEMRCIDEYLKNHGRFTEKIRREICELSGFFPATDEMLMRFCEMYIDEMQKADIIALWGVGAEAQVVHQHCMASKFTELHALEPYYFDSPWSAALQGKKVLVIHPFQISIQRQYENREFLYPGRKVLPSFEKLTCIKAVQSIAGEKTEYASWFEALDSMKRAIDNADFDIAIIGAGAYGLPLATYCKEIGKKAIQMSGATQLLFGIKGKRWDEHPVISRFYNDAWIRPDESETPIQKNKVEGGSYW